MLNLDLAKLTPYVTAEQLNSMADEVAAAHSKLYDPSFTTGYREKTP